MGVFPLFLSFHYTPVLTFHSLNHNNNNNNTQRTYPMKLDHIQTQQVKTAFQAYSQMQPKIPLAMIDQFICGAIANLTFEQLQELKKGKGSADGFDLPQFFALVNSNEAFQHFCIANFPPAPENAKAPEVDALELKCQKGF